MFYRKLVFFSLVLNLTILLSADTKTDLYKKVVPSVVYLRHELFISSSSVSNLQVWTKFEQFLGVKIIDQYLPIVTGSGFFVDDHGRILTNRHVADINGLDEFRQTAKDSFNNYCDSLRFVFGTSIATLKQDFNAMLKTAKYRFSAFSGNDYLGELKVLAANPHAENDLALVELSNYSSKPLELFVAPNDFAFTGLDVFAFGYPLGQSMDSLFKDRIATMSTGTITGFRRGDELDIQHSATITFGNSGGPLVDGSGRVIGINTAITIDKNVGNFNYSISSNSVREFLKNAGYDSVNRWNMRLAGTTDSDNESKTFEINFSSNIEDTEVWIDGLRVGNCPISYDLPEGTYDLVCKSESGVFENRQIQVGPNFQKNISLVGRQGTKIRFKDLDLSQVTSIEFKNKNVSFSGSVRDDGVFALPGSYKALIHGVLGLESIVFDITVGESDFDFDLTRFYLRSSLRIKNLRPESQVWVDDIMVKAKGDTLENLQVGVHQIKIWTEGYAPLDNKEITVRNTSKSFITMKYEPDLLAKSSGDVWVGLGLVAAGAGSFALALANEERWREINATPGWSTPYTVDYGLRGLAYALWGVGLILEIDAIGLSIKFDEQKRSFYENLKN